VGEAHAGGRGARRRARRAPAGEGAEAHDLQPGEVFGVSAWVKAAGLQPGVVAMSSSARVGVGEGLVACSSESLSTSGVLGATGKLSGIWVGLWGSASGGAAQISASMFIPICHRYLIRRNLVCALIMHRP